MSEQFELDLSPQQTNNDSSMANSIQEKFEVFHALNPFVYQNLVKLARKLHERGRTQVGMKMLFEMLRWNYMMNTDDPNSEFKLSNSYTSRYSRLIMKQELDLDGLFSVKQLRSE